MRADAQPAFFGAPHRIDIFTQAMTAIHPGERAVIHGFESDFEPQVSLLRQVAQQIKRVVRQTVGPGRDRQPDNAGKVEGLTIEDFELRRGIVCIGVTLKVSDKFLCPVALLYGHSARFKLRRNRASGPVVLRRMARVVTINTAAHRDFAVTVGTGKIQPQADLVDARVEPFTQYTVKRVKSFAAPANCQRVGKIHELNTQRVNKKAENTQGDELPG